MFLRLILALLTGLVAVSGSAHADIVRRSNIANGQEFGFSPFFYQVEYAKPLTLRQVRLVNVSEKHDVPMDFVPRSVAAQSHAVPLPVLAPHRYRLTWVAQDLQGNDASGAVEFSIAGCETPGAAPAGAAASSRSIQVATKKR